MLAETAMNTQKNIQQQFKSGLEKFCRLGNVGFLNSQSFPAVIADFSLQQKS